MSRSPLMFTVAALAALAGPLTAQQLAAARKVVKVEIMPASLDLAVGDSARLTARALDDAGNPVESEFFYFSRSKHGVGVSKDGWVKALAGGEHPVGAFAIAGSVQATITVHVAYPPIESIEITGPGARPLAGATLNHKVLVRDRAKVERAGVDITWKTSDPAVATVTAGGALTLHRAGRVVLSATAGGVTGSLPYTVEANPIRRVMLSASAASVRTGDVVHVTAKALDARGNQVTNAPITFAVSSTPEDTVIAQFPTAEVDQKGRFVAQKAGQHTVVAVVGGVAGQVSIEVGNRGVSQDIKLVGRAAIIDKPTSDLYVWKGKDGRDYMVSGTFSSQAYFYDVTDPADPVLTDSVVVDARVVNDVSVNDAGDICVISREGASNRKNGIVILDCSDPHHVKILSTFDDGLWGGVHNVNIWKHYVFAVNDGVPRFDVIDIQDPKAPKRVGIYELPSDNPSKYLHDVWVVDGIAYASYWDDGVVLVDVGNGKYGGTPEKPVKFNQYKYPIGATHASYPYKSATGRFYIVTGDEMGPKYPNPRIEGVKQPGQMGGYAHFIDFTDPAHPEEVARYEVPDAGSHNFWIEDDKLYASFYNGGLRVVDISGELKGNLTYQGREIAKFLPYDDKSSPPNSPFVMGPQLYKGNIWMADMTSGLWGVKLEPKKRPLVP
ncbi:MAG: hypothetical protein ABI647_12595 [Gemmatimonadota bacterium]